MSLLHAASAEGTVEELSLFTLPPTQTCVENMNFVEYRPVSQITDNMAPVEFDITGSGMEYIDLSRTRLYVKCKITNGDGSDIDDTPLTDTEGKSLPPKNTIGPVNLLLHSMFSQVDVYLNEKLMSTAHNNYPYKAYLQTLLKYGADAKETQLMAQMYIKDTPVAMDNGDSIAGSNYGLINRSTFTRKSSSVEMEGVLLEDVFQLDRYLMNNIPIRIKLYPQRPAFSLMSNEANPDYKLVIEDIVIRACQIRLSSGSILGHAAALQTSNALYPFTRREVRSHTIPKGYLSTTLDNYLNGMRPNKLTLCFLSSAAYNGSYAKNPFNLQHFHLKDLAVYVDGNSVSGRPLRTHYTKNKTPAGSQYVTPYFNMFAGSQKSGKENGGNQISRSDFMNGYNIYIFPLDPYLESLEEGTHLPLQHSSNIRIEMSFAEALPETVNLLVLAEYTSLFEVDKSRAIIYNPNN